MCQIKTSSTRTIPHLGERLGAGPHRGERVQKQTRARGEEFGEKLRMLLVAARRDAGRQLPAVHARCRCSRRSHTHTKWCRSKPSQCNIATFTPKPHFTKPPALVRLLGLYTRKQRTETGNRKRETGNRETGNRETGNRETGNRETGNRGNGKIGHKPHPDKTRSARLSTGPASMANTVYATVTPA